MNSLLDLLPKGGKSVVDSLQNETRFLRRILFLIQEAEEGISHFLKGNLSHFDPHVGDTACHIRACYFSYLWINREEILPDLERDRSSLKSYAEKVLVVMDQSLRNSHRPLRPCFLDEFLSELNVGLFFGEISLNIIVSHLLSKYAFVDEKEMPQSINQDLLNQSMHESVAFCTALVRSLQRKLSIVSVEFVIFLSQLLSKKGLILSGSPALFESLVKEDSCGRKQLPCIAVFELIANFMKCNSKVSCVWIVDFLELKSRRAFFFKADKNGKWKYSSLNDLLEESPIFLIRAATFMESNEKFLFWCHQFGVDKILSWFGAVHPQYSGMVEFSFPKEYQVFFEENFNLAVSHQIALLPTGKEALLIRHISVCEKKTVFQKIQDLPCLYESEEYEALESCSPC
jgi:hypothetical protein